MDTNTFLGYAVVGPVQRLLPPASSSVPCPTEAPYIVQRTTTTASSVLARLGAALARVGERFSDSVANAERNRRERWLAQATDIYDLERRMQDFDRRSMRGAF
jgi:hypothetical protein